MRVDSRKLHSTELMPITRFKPKTTFHLANADDQFDQRGVTEFLDFLGQADQSRHQPKY